VSDRDSKITISIPVFNYKNRVGGALAPWAFINHPSIHVYENDSSRLHDLCSWKADLRY